MPNISKLGIIDSGAAYHIRTITGISKGTASSLNRQDYEAINYLAATEGFTTLPIIIDRINYEYKFEIKKLPFLILLDSENQIC